MEIKYIHEEMKMVSNVTNITDEIMKIEERLYAHLYASNVGQETVPAWSARFQQQLKKRWKSHSRG